MIIKDRLVNAYNKSRYLTGEPKMIVIIDEDSWTMPPNVYKDTQLDGWYNSITGEQVDPSTFWKTKEVDVAVGNPLNETATITSQGIVYTSNVEFFVLYEFDDLLMNAYGFIVGKSIYKMLSFYYLPSEDDPSLIGLRLIQWVS